MSTSDQALWQVAEKALEAAFGEKKGASARGVAGASRDVSGPVQLLDVAADPSGVLACEVNAQRLVPVDADDAELSGIFVPTPVKGHVLLSRDGKIRSVDIPAPDPATTREVRAWARSLVANDQVKGIAAATPSSGPRSRPTHHVVTDAAGRRVIRRIGYSAF